LCSYFKQCVCEQSIKLKQHAKCTTQ